MNLKKKLKEMDKAITREDMINAARKLYKSGWWQSEQLDAVLEEMFPELKESEDERIRKAMLNSLKEAEDSIVLTPFKKKSWISYLEKLKEPLPIPNKFSGLKSLMLQYLQSAANRKDDAEIEDDTDLWGRKILDYVWKYSDAQKEQKPVEWNEESKNRIAYNCHIP